MGSQRVRHNWATELNWTGSSLQQEFFSCCSQRVLLSSLVCRLLIAVASLVAERGLWVHGFRNCGSQALGHRFHSCVSWALLLHGMWDLSGSRIKPVSLELADMFFTTGPPGEPWTGTLLVPMSQGWFLCRISQLIVKGKQCFEQCLTCCAPDNS